MIKESCVESYIDAFKAQKNGANRIELCDNLAVGGTTPSYGTIITAHKELKIPIFPMIRPRGRDFVYSSDEIQIMKKDILICKEIGIPGVVFGVLTKDNKIAYHTTEELVKLAYPMEVTFHKAIDELEDPVLEVRKLCNIGVKRILTSGGCSSALEGYETINKMIQMAKDDITIVVAGGVTKDNFEELTKLIHGKEFHGRKIV